MSETVLKLYIAGMTSRSEKTISDVKSILDKNFSKEYILNIVDVLEDTQTAKDNGILITPTLIKEVPNPARRIVGDFSNKVKVLRGLELLVYE